MANKRIKKKYDWLTEHKKQLYATERELNRQIRQERKLVNTINKSIKNTREAGIIPGRSKLVASIQRAGEAIQTKHLLESRLQRLVQQKIEVHNKIVGLNLSRKIDLEMARSNAVSAKNTIKTALLSEGNKQKIMKSLRAKFPFADDKMIEEELQRTLRSSLASLEGKENENQLLYDYKEYYEGEVLLRNVDNATYWAAIKEYNDQVKKGNVPALNGLDKYESALWAMDHLPYYEVKQLLEKAYKKGRELEARAIQKEMEYRKEWNEIQIFLE